MKTLVIHPKDSTTDFLCEIYKDKNWTVINTNTSKKVLKEQIKAHDRIVMLVVTIGSYNFSPFSKKFEWSHGTRTIAFAELPKPYDN